MLYYLGEGDVADVLAQRLLELLDMSAASKTCQQLEKDVSS
jgi:hypothetical protein